MYLVSVDPMDRSNIALFYYELSQKTQVHVECKSMLLLLMNDFNPLCSD